ncbi:hypothetical protein HMI54_005528 [Coelomomyces lativittatus]|nr:hypothetical protein HMI56_002363 [Coelomomyces lativittatus]KAJ1517137.1 hypothetical protein HMI55_000542 [Coelomomyces lativittatus]KAJ1517445.1 hypothetical protein HMI54_005528 [Coelomomyces lativittatus]
MATKESQVDEEKASPFLASLNNECNRFFTKNLDTRVKACIEIGHIIHLGDETVILNVSKNDELIKELLSFFLEENIAPFSLQLAAMQTLSILVRSSSIVRSSLQTYGVLNVFKMGLVHPEEELRIYACHALFFFIAKRPEKFSFFFIDSEIKEALRKAALDDWSLFLYNDAEEIMKLVDIMYDPYAVSGCITSRNTGVQIHNQPILETDMEQ